MREILENLDTDNEDYDPIKKAQILAKRELPKKFYQLADVTKKENGFAVVLDGKVVKTPARNELVLPNQELARLVADEFNLQNVVIDPAKMPVTRLANTVLDSIAANPDAVRDDIKNFIAHDMLFYRADTPRELADRQNTQWNPILDWAHKKFNAPFILTEGVIHIEQPKSSLQSIGNFLDKILSPYSLAAFHSMTTLSGSALLALAVFCKEIDLDNAWKLAHLDEDWTNEHWGEDREALSRREYYKTNFDAAAAIVAAINDNIPQ